jgi:hypothetical protein
MLSERNEGKPAEYPAHYKKEFEWLRAVDSFALCNVQRQHAKISEEGAGQAEKDAEKTLVVRQITCQ